jgi:hypothetical protein
MTLLLLSSGQSKSMTVLNMEATKSAKKSAPIYKSTQHHIPERSNLYASSGTLLFSISEDIYNVPNT